MTRFAPRIEELLADAEAGAREQDWDAVRALATAVLALDAANTVARRLLDQAAPPASEGERRQLTVMFCDVVGSTALSERVDPELVRDVLRSYQSTCDGVIRRYDGYVARYFGDGILAYFGYPRAHEDDARRAVKAGLDLLEALRDDERASHGIDLAVRVAVHTGFVVRADMGTPVNPDRDAIIGETPNIAARLQEEARAGTLLISGSTYDLVQGFFDVTPRGALTLKGVSRPLDAFEVVSEATATRFKAGPELTPFVGRAAEMGALHMHWSAAAAGGTSAVLVRGEPGIGKSRLAEQLRHATNASVLLGACSAYHTTTHLYPARRIVEAASGLHERDDPLVQLRDTLAAIGCEHALPLLAELLGIPPEPWCPAPQLDGLRLREETLAALVDCIVALAATTPVLVVVEDLQWADPSTIELLGRVLTRKVPNVMLLLTARPEFVPPWNIDTIDVARLEPPEVVALVASIPQSRALPRATVDEVVVRSDGVPLFVEELVRSAALSRPGSAPGHTIAASVGSPRSGIPAPLRDPLLARLAAPGVDLELVQTMATIGREVRHEVLSAVTGVSSAQLQSRVEGLVNARLVDASEPSLLRFHHHLIGELAYETQLLPKRKQRHGEIADVLRSAAFEGRPLDFDAGAIAYHLERAGRAAEAIESYMRAARVAMGHGAYAEADVKLSHALSLLDDVDDAAARVSLELKVRQLRGSGALGMFGYAAPRAVEDFQRCLELSGQLEPRAEHLLSLSGLWSYYAIQGGLDRAEELLDEMRTVALQLPAEARAGAIPEEAGWGVTRLFRGDISGAIDALEAFLSSPFASAAAEPPEDWPLPNDVVGAIWAHLALARCIAGDVGGARAALTEASARADKVPFPHGPFTKAYALTFGAMVLAIDGDFAASEAAINEISEIADRHGFMFFSMCAAMQNAIYAARAGQPYSTGLLEGAIAMWRATGADAWTPCFATELGAAHLASGNAKAAIAVLNDALAVAEQSGSRMWTALTLALLGEARILDGDDGGAADINAAVGVAVEQGARLFELTARTALVRLLGGSDHTKGLAELTDSFAGVETLTVVTARDVLAAAAAR